MSHNSLDFYPKPPETTPRIVKKAVIAAFMQYGFAILCLINGWPGLAILLALTGWLTHKCVVPLLRWYTTG
jgi:hypothetical protein